MEDNTKLTQSRVVNVYPTLKLNNPEDYEHLCNVVLTKEKFPKAYHNKVVELIKDCGMTAEEAEIAIADMEIELEVYYSPGCGLFAVESEAVESGTIYDPYTGKMLEDAD